MSKPVGKATMIREAFNELLASSPSRLPERKEVMELAKRKNPQVDFRYADYKNAQLTIEYQAHSDENLRRLLDEERESRRMRRKLKGKRKALVTQAMKESLQLLIAHQQEARMHSADWKEVEAGAQYMKSVGGYDRAVAILKALAGKE